VYFDYGGALASSTYRGGNLKNLGVERRGSLCTRFTNKRGFLGPIARGVGGLGAVTGVWGELERGSVRD